MNPTEAKAKYDALYQEYQDVMHAGAWRLGWGFFFVLVGLLPMMYFFVWLVGPNGWEKTFLHAPKLMWLAPPVNLSIVVFLLFRLYRKNLELDLVKRRYLGDLRALKAHFPPESMAESAEAEVREFESDY